MMFRHPPRLIAYAIAIFLVVLAIALTFFYNHWYGQSAFAFFYLAVCISTWYGGRYPGLATTALSLIAINYFFIPPFYDWVPSVKDTVRLGICAAVMLLIHWLVSELVDSRSRVEHRTAALQESEARYRMIVEDQSELIVRFLPDGTILFVNEAYCRYFGLQRQSLIGKSYAPVIFEADLETVNQQVRSLSPNNPIVTIENRVIVNDEIRWTQWINHLFSNQDGQTVEIQAVGRDITNLKHTEEALRLSENRLKLALEGSGDGLWEWNIATGDLYLDTNWLGMLGYADGELPLQAGLWNPLIHPDDLPWVTERLNAHLQDSHNPYSFEYRVRTKSGDWKWVANYGKVVARSENGAPLRMLGTHRDISIRRRVEDARKYAEAQLRNLSDRLTLALKSGAIGTWDWDLIHEAWWDDRMYELYGLQHLGRAATYQDWVACLHPEDRENAETALQLALRGEREFDTEFRAIHPDGTLHYIKAFAVVQRNAQGDPQRMVGINYDISDRKQIEANLKQYERIVSSTKDGIALIDHNCIYQVVNQGYLDWCHRSHADVVGHSVRDVLGAELFDSFTQPRLAQCLEGQIIRYEKWFDYPEGVPQFLSVTYTPYLDGNQTITGVIVSQRDITELQQVENSLRISEERLQLALEGSGDGLWDWNIVTGQVYRSALWQKMLGYPEQECLVDISSWGQLIHPEDKPWVTKLLDTHLKDGSTPYAFDYRILTQSGEWKWVANYGKVVARDQQGNPLRMVGTHKDISDRKQAEEQLRISAERISLANAELSRAARLKDEFLAGMSHELRTPLNAILGMSEVLLEEIHGPLTPGQQESVTLIEHSGEHLLTLINDILDLAKIESGKMELEIGSVDVQQLCDTSLSFVKQQAYQKRLHLRCNLDETIGEIELDERRMGQALINLLSNAVKFTPEGGRVHLSVSVNQEQETIEFAVSDTGIGIAAEQMDNLFQPFVQLDSRLSRRYSGTGLGLVLVRRIVELHGGSIRLESEVGRGSCFTMTLPWRRVPLLSDEPTPTPATANQPSSIQRALIIEDSESAANQVLRYLTELGATAVVHPLGAGVVDLALQIKPDVIILDILLPDLPGWDVLIELKAHPVTRTIPVFIISVVDDRPKGLALGAANYLLKPITRMQLQNALNQLTGGVNDEQKTALVVANQLLTPLIVLAEDNEANIEVILNYLEAYGLHTAIARNGLEAVQLVKRCQPDLVLMDIQMPEMDGLEATRQIRAEPQMKSLPIFALTALAMPGDRERCLTNGANEYLTKPVSLKQLLTLIKQYLPNWSS